MKYLFSIVIMTILCLCTPALNAATVTTTPPQITITAINGTPVNILLDVSDTGYNDAYLSANLNAQNVMDKYKNQNELANGFANANAYASRAATQQGYQDYDLFALTTGFMLGVQAPSAEPSYMNKIEDDIEEDGDIYAGLGTGVAFFNVGINSKFLYPGLYINVAFGSMNVDQFEDKNFIAKSTLFGIGASYSWIQSKSILLKLIKWRGLSFGSGFYYNKTDIDLLVEMDPSMSEFTYDAGGTLGTIDGRVIITPSYNMGLEVSTCTIPLDVTTAVQLLWVLNLNLGLGIDFSWGKSDIILKSKGSVTGVIDSPDNVEYSVTPGGILIDGSTKGGKPAAVNPRITAGIGINILPVKIDIPVAYYFVEQGMSVGVTAGIIW